MTCVFDTCDDERVSFTTPGDQQPGSRRLRRSRSSRVVAGVASGIAEHLEVKVFAVRLVFTILAGLAGAGVVAYALCWIFIPQQPVDAVEHTQTARERRRGFGLVVVVVGLLITLAALSGSVGVWFFYPLLITLGGVVLVWREADESVRRKWKDGARSGVSGVFLGVSGSNTLVRLIAGVVLVGAGINIFLLQSGKFSQMPIALLAVLATLAGVAVLTVPWWLRLVRELNEERRARIRTEERAEIAAHLHDSVLQTLALIQKQAGSSREIVRLARSQERQLRAWLYGVSGYGGSSTPGQADSLTQAVAKICAEVEDTFAITATQVVVGDCPTDDKLIALIQAAREAIVNAAKHSGAEEVSVYVEVEPTAGIEWEKVTVFVRDRGRGFDPEQVSSDRHGLADSIQGRMARNGGQVVLRTKQGEGTEVQLQMPRKTSRETST